MSESDTHKHSEDGTSSSSSSSSSSSFIPRPTVPVQDVVSPPLCPFPHPFSFPLPSLDMERQIKYFSMYLHCVPGAYSSLDTSRMTLLYFSLSSLDILGALDDVFHQHTHLRQNIIDWIYAMQVIPDKQESQASINRCGFRGGPGNGAIFDPKQSSSSCHPYDEGNLAMTYSALNNLIILGDDLSRVNKKAIIKSLTDMQTLDGSFSSTSHQSENDMRFLYCACAISSMLGDWSGFDIERSARFAANCQTYDGGIGLNPQLEGHGGSTYCAIASLTLMNKLHYIPNRTRLLKWCINNQGCGFKGRPNKPEDTCYSFWLGATLHMLDGYQYTQPRLNRCFNLSCQHKLGGFGKDQGAYPDLLHAYFGVCGLALCGLDGLQPIDVTLGLSVKSASRIGALRYGDVKRTYISSAPSAAEALDFTATQTSDDTADSSSS